MSFLSKEKLRYLISFILTFVIHGIFLVILHYGVSIRVEALPEYSGPLYIEIGEHSISEDEEARVEIKKEEVTAKIEKTEVEEKKKEPVEKIKEKIEKKEQIIEEVHVDSSKIETVTIEETTKAHEDLEAEDRIAKEEENVVTEEEKVEALENEEYIPGLEETSLDRLDKLLKESKESETENVAEGDSKDIKVSGDSLIDKDEKGTRISWEDNQVRVPLNNPNPEVPDWVSREGITKLEVAVSFSLTSEGFLTNLKIEKSSGHTDVDESFIVALRKWRYSSGSSVENVKGTGTFSITIK